jgi:UDP-glucose 4-epimerase
MTPERVVITGANGFVGHHLMRELTAGGHRCFGLSRSACDLTDAVAVREFFREWRSSTVIHLASKMPGFGDDSIENMLLQNVISTENLLKEAPSLTAFIYISTIDVYGVPKKLPLSEASETEPGTNYAISKLAAEKLAKARCDAAGIPWCILRLSHIYGVGDRQIKVIPKMIERIANRQSPEIFGDGSDLRDFIHVRDVGRAVRGALENEICGVINVASGRSVSVRQLAEIIIGLSDDNLEPIFKPRQSRQVDLQFDVSKLKEVLNFTAQEDLTNGLRELYDERARLVAI